MSLTEIAQKFAILLAISIPILIIALVVSNVNKARNKSLKK